MVSALVNSDHPPNDAQDRARKEFAETPIDMLGTINSGGEAAYQVFLEAGYGDRDAERFISDIADEAIMVRTNPPESWTLVDQINACRNTGRAAEDMRTFVNPGDDYYTSLGEDKFNFSDDIRNKYHELDQFDNAFKDMAVVTLQDQSLSQDEAIRLVDMALNFNVNEVSNPFSPKVNGDLNRNFYDYQYSSSYIDGNHKETFDRMIEDTKLVRDHGDLVMDKDSQEKRLGNMLNTVSWVAGQPDLQLDTHQVGEFLNLKTSLALQNPEPSKYQPYDVFSPDVVSDMQYFAGSLKNDLMELNDFKENSVIPTANNALEKGKLSLPQMMVVDDIISYPSLPDFNDISRLDVVKGGRDYGVYVQQMAHPTMAGDTPELINEAVAKSAKGLDIIYREANKSDGYKSVRVGEEVGNSFARELSTLSASGHKFDVKSMEALTNYADRLESSKSLEKYMPVNPREVISSQMDKYDRYVERQVRQAAREQKIEAKLVSKDQTELDLGL